VVNSELFLPLQWTGEGARPHTDIADPIDHYCRILGFATEYNKSVKKFTST
jgi:hypothetical protein